MISILSWNVQNGKGRDGRISLARIADVVVGMGTPDVICLQEVSRGLPLGVDAGAPDQIAELMELFPEYEIVFGVAVDALCTNMQGRWQYGNAVLTRLPLLFVSTHPLPRPGVAGVRHMIRQATEVVLETAAGSLRVVNLHLEFHSKAQRLAQVERLRDLQREVLEEQSLPPKIDRDGPYQSVARPVDAVFCGDFNMLRDSDEYRRLLTPLAAEARPFHDAWELVHPDIPHDPTCGIYDHNQWPEGPHCRDFFFVAGECVTAVSSMRVNTKTDASDHQPLIIELSDRRG
jgi:endonuclease/exonuclease/phosphatase family metal-dependent hydrolase